MYMYGEIIEGIGLYECSSSSRCKRRVKLSPEKQNSRLKAQRFPGEPFQTGSQWPKKEGFKYINKWMNEYVK